MFFNCRSDEAGGEEPFEDEQYIYYDDEVDFEDARSSEVDRLDTAETSYAKNRLRDEPHLAKAAKARLQSAASAAKGKYGSGGNRNAIQFCREIAHLASFFQTMHFSLIDLAIWLSLTWLDVNHCSRPH